MAAKTTYVPYFCYILLHDFWFLYDLELINLFLMFFYQNDLYLDGIMHKWANPHLYDMEKKSCSNMKYRIKRIKTNLHEKVTKSVTK